MAKKEPLYGQISVSERAELTDFKLDPALNLGWGAGVRPQSWDQIGPWGLGWGGWVGEACWVSFFLKSRRRRRAINVPWAAYSLNLLFVGKERRKITLQIWICTIHLVSVIYFSSFHQRYPVSAVRHSRRSISSALTSWSCDGQSLTSSHWEDRWYEPTHGLHVKQLSVSLSLLAFFSFTDRKRSANVSNNWLPCSNSSVKWLLD